MPSSLITIHTYKHFPYFVFHDKLLQQLQQEQLLGKDSTCVVVGGWECGCLTDHPVKQLRSFSLETLLSSRCNNALINDEPLN